MSEYATHHTMVTDFIAMIFFTRIGAGSPMLFAGPFTIRWKISTAQEEESICKTCRCLSLGGQVPRSGWGLATKLEGVFSYGKR